MELQDNLTCYTYTSMITSKCIVINTTLSRNENLYPDPYTIVIYETEYDKQDDMKKP